MLVEGAHFSNGSLRSSSGLHLVEVIKSYLSIVVRVRIGNHVPYFSRAHLDLEVRGEPLEVLGGDRVPLIRVEQREDLS